MIFIFSDFCSTTMHAYYVSINWLIISAKRHFICPLNISKILLSWHTSRRKFWERRCGYQETCSGSLGKLCLNLWWFYMYTVGH